VLELFDRVFLLRIDLRTQEDRLAASDDAHHPGRTEAGRQQIRDGLETFQAEMIERGATAIDGRLPTEQVVDRLLPAVRGDVIP
jgi:hypothetical protein